MKRKYRNMERGPLPIQLKDNAYSVPSLGYFEVEDEQMTGSFRVQISQKRVKEIVEKEAEAPAKSTAPTDAQKAALLEARANQERKGDKVPVEKPEEPVVEPVVEEEVEPVVEETPEVPLEELIVKDEEKGDDTLTKDEESVELDSEDDSAVPEGKKKKIATKKKPAKKKRRRQKKSDGQ